MINPTREQQLMIDHSPERHARAVCGPGTGKSATIRAYVRHLLNAGMSMSRLDILVLTFNRAPKLDLRRQFQTEGLPRKEQPMIENFHSLALKIIEDFTGERARVMSESQAWLFANRAINYLERNDAIIPGAVDAQDALDAIQMYKSSLIPPHRAGHRVNQNIPPIYTEFEKQRKAEGLIGFDDFVPEAIKVLKTRGLRRKPKMIIVDEFQDTAYGYLELIRLLAGDWATVVVVGDDDQNLYEWNGTRAQYVLDFNQHFTSKPHSEYIMTRCFRFGPVIAQAAHNVIRHNNVRVEKPIIAYDAARPGFVQVIEDVAEGDSNKELAGIIYDLVKNQGVSPSEVRVLVRTFSQLAGLESELLAHRVPYEVRGKTPFFKRGSCTILMDYITLAQRLYDEIDEELIDLACRVLNVPGRKIKRDHLRTALIRAQRGSLPGGNSLSGVLQWLGRADNSTLYKRQKMSILDWYYLLKALFEMDEQPADDALKYVVDHTGYFHHLIAYYGDGYEAFDRKRAVLNFIKYARSTKLNALEFIHHIENLDTRQGAPRGQYIVMTTGYREKGCEYDYVIIPECVEEYMPCLNTTQSPIYDKEGIVDEPDPTPLMEGERRLFYVALTRAKKGVFIGTSNGMSGKLPSRFIDEMQLEETEVIMGALQQYAAGGDEKQVIQALKKWGNIPHVTSNLLGHYLPDLGASELADQVAALIEQLPEKGFHYRYAYQAPEHERDVTDEYLHVAWQQTIEF